MDISPSGGLGVCSAGDGKMWIWDTANGEIRVSRNFVYLNLHIVSFPQTCDCILVNNDVLESIHCTYILHSEFLMDILEIYTVVDFSHLE